mgnify:CR=1 FL=1
MIQRIDAARDRIRDAILEMNEDEVLVLLHVADGLITGRGVYGRLRLDEDRRDFRKETMEEVRDALVYVAAELVRSQKGSGNVTDGA